MTGMINFHYVSLASRVINSLSLLYTTTCVFTQILYHLIRNIVRLYHLIRNIYCISLKIRLFLKI